MWIWFHAESKAESLIFSFFCHFIHMRIFNDRITSSLTGTQQSQNIVLFLLLCICSILQCVYNIPNHKSFQSISRILELTEIRWKNEWNWRIIIIIIIIASETPFFSECHSVRVVNKEWNSFVQYRSTQLILKFRRTKYKIFSMSSEWLFPAIKVGYKSGEKRKKAKTTENHGFG